MVSYFIGCTIWGGEGHTLNPPLARIKIGREIRNCNHSRAVIGQMICGLHTPRMAFRQFERPAPPIPLGLCLRHVNI